MAKFLITSALPYVNGVKHLGNLAGSLLPADIHARFRRQTGHEVLFLCGTDEHGTPAELAAQAAGLPVAEYCARQHARAGRHLSSLRPLVRSLLANLGRRQPAADAGTLPAPRCRRLHRAAHDPAGLFGHRQAFPSRPLCASAPALIAAVRTPAATSAKAARACSTPDDLVSPRSAISGATDVEFRETRHLFLKLSAIRGPTAPMDRDATRLAAAGALDRNEMAR